jgi:hypothetical protein
MSGPDEKNGPEVITVPVQNVAAARALEVVKYVIENEAGRAAYRRNPQRAFDETKEKRPEPPLRTAKYADIPTRSRALLEELSEDELALLSRLDQTFIEDGLYVDVPSPGKLHYK